MSKNTLTTADTEDADTNTLQAEAAKTYSQEEVNDMMARVKSSSTKKALKPYEDLGDVEELRGLRANAESNKQEQALKRGEYDIIIKDLAAKKDVEIQKRDNIIKGYKIDSPLLESASKYRSVNAEQVKSLLKGSVRLNEEGEVEVVDAKGTVRYADNGDLFTVDALVQSFLDSNPHFVSPTLATTNTKSSFQSNANEKFDLSKLDMSNPVHRKQYSEAKASGKLKA